MYRASCKKRERRLSQYYYTIASLPFLDFDTEPPFTYDEFLEACSKECSVKDYTLIKNISLLPLEIQENHCPLSDLFHSWERSLRNELVLLRAKKKGSPPEKYLRQGKETLGPEQLARSAFHQESPLAAEQIIQKARWRYLDQLEVGHYFDVEKLIIYKLKLEILEEKSKAVKEKGREFYDSLMHQYEEELSGKC